MALNAEEPQMSSTKMRGTAVVVKACVVREA
jgi:hypothetical protein